MISDVFADKVLEHETAIRAKEIVQACMRSGLSASDALATFSLIIAMLVGSYCDLQREQGNAVDLDEQLCSAASVIAGLAPLVTAASAGADDKDKPFPTKETFHMDPATRTALLGSIAKWEAIVAGTGRDHFASNCPLCVHFELEHNKRREAYGYDEDGEERLDKAFPLGDCTGCPVAEKTNCSGCSDTPYNAWGRHHAMEHSSNERPAPGGLAVVPGCDKCLRLAQAELNFLRSLLPGEASDAS